MKVTWSIIMVVNYTFRKGGIFCLSQEQDVSSQSLQVNNLESPNIDSICMEIHFEVGKEVITFCNA